MVREGGGAQLERVPLGGHQGGWAQPGEQVPDQVLGVRFPIEQVQERVQLVDPDHADPAVQLQPVADVGHPGVEQHPLAHLLGAAVLGDVGTDPGAQVPQVQPLPRFAALNLEDRRRAGQPGGDQVPLGWGEQVPPQVQVLLQHPGVEQHRVQNRRDQGVGQFTALVQDVVDQVAQVAVVAGLGEQHRLVIQLVGLLPHRDRPRPGRRVTVAQLVLAPRPARARLVAGPPTQAQPPCPHGPRGAPVPPSQ